MWNTHFQRPPSPVPLYLPARKHSTSMQHFCLTDAPGQYSLLQIGISVTPMPINSFLLRLRQQTGDFLPFTLENEFSVLNTMQTPPAAKWNPACSLTAILVLWATIIEVSGKGEEEIWDHGFCSIIWKAAPLACFIRYPVGNSLLYVALLLLGVAS